MLDRRTRRPSFGASTLRRATTAAVVILAVCVYMAMLQSVNADVVGRGDVTPSMDVNGNEVPDLPQFGGPVSGTITVGGTGMQVGGTDLGTMTVDIPQDTDPLESDDGIIGGVEAGSGIVTIVSLNSEWRLNNTLTVGDEGVGVLEVLAGARVTSNFGTTGIGLGPDTIVGAVPGSQGFITVDGFGSKLQNVNFSIGERGHGRMEVLDFARVDTTGDAFIGNTLGTQSDDVVGGNGTVFVDGLGTRWNIGFGDGTLGGTGDLTVGNEGRGVLEVRNEAWVRVQNDAFVGVEANSYGEITVDGQGTLLWVIEQMSIGDSSDTSAQGQVYVNNQGTLRADDDMTVEANGRVDMGGVQSTGNYIRGGTILTPDLVNNGVIRGDGRIETSGSFTNAVGGDVRNASATANHRERLLITGPVDNSGIFESIGGEMEFEGTFTNNASAQIFGKDAVFRFRGVGGLVQNGAMTLENSVVESTVTVSNAALLSVGQGRSTVIGDLALGGSSDLEMILGDEHSELSVTGDAMLDGTLDISLDDGFSPILGESFRIIVADSVSGMFASELFPEISGIGFSVSYTADEVYVNVTTGPIITADFDGDGDVDGDDLANGWEPNFGTLTGSTRARGDANGDGDTDGRDFLLWQRQKNFPATAHAGAVPEPSAAVLALLGMGLCAGRRKR